MVSESSLPHLQEPATCTYPEPDQSPSTLTNLIDSLVTQTL